MKGGARTRVAIVGGGCASMAAAFELSRPEHQGRFDVTVYQLGWRLGGKGASGRGIADRIEEHGLHLWMGYYENAFRLMRECYAELARDPRRCPVADWTDAFSPAHFNGVADRLPGGGWSPWTAHLPANPGLPGDPTGYRKPTAMDYFLRTFELARTLLQTLRTRAAAGEAATGGTGGDASNRGGGPVVDTVSRLLRYGGIVGLGGMLEALRLMEMTIRISPVGSDTRLLGLHEVVTRALRHQVERLTANDHEVRRLWEMLDLVLALIRGTIRSRLATDPRGFDAIDHLDYREWLALNGASRAALDNGIVRALYDLVFAYEDGDVERPRIAAGQAARGALRAFFTYRGAFFWKMRAGMGDIVFAPLYEVLKRRGVKFQFFHRLSNVGLGGTEKRGHPHVASLRFDVQARVVGGGEYQPLREIRGLPCWPSAPDYRQLVRGNALKREGWAFERHFERRRAAARTLRVGRDFDLVILGIGLGAIPHVCPEIVSFDPRWRDLTRHVKCVGTQAFQIWTSATAKDLGWRYEAVNLSGFVEPFDTWADMTHLIPEESWARPPGMIGYFCSVLPGHALRGAESPAAFDHVSGRVRRDAVRFLATDIRHLWPRAVDRGGRFRWNLLADPRERAEPVERIVRKPPRARRSMGPARFDAQYWRANVDPSDRYTLSLPGTTRYRISPLDQTYDNMAVAGDWTENGLNMGCVEAAVMSGRLAAHALSRSPALEDIVGFDHP